MMAGHQFDTDHPRSSDGTGRFAEKPQHDPGAGVLDHAQVKAAFDLSNKWFPDFTGDDCAEALAECDGDVERAEAWLAAGLKVKTGYASLERSWHALTEARQAYCDGNVFTAVARIRQAYPQVARVVFENMANGPTFLAFDADNAPLDMDRPRSGDTAAELGLLGGELAGSPSLIRRWSEEGTFRSWPQHDGRVAFHMQLDLAKIPA